MRKESFSLFAFNVVKDNHSLSEWIKSLQLWTKINSCNTIEATDNRNKSKTGGLMKDIDSLAQGKYPWGFIINR